MMVRDEHITVLDKVCTVSEAARAVGYHPAWVRKLCDMGFIAAKKSGRDWIIYLDSLVQYSYRDGNK